jgi:hypothetical protein
MRTSLKPIQTFYSLALALAVVLPAGSLSGQTQPAQPTPTALNLVVVAGEGEMTKIKERVKTEPAVRVENEANKPVIGAAVVFTLPTEGATGEFANGSKNLTVLTDSQGMAVAKGLKMNQVGGKLPIHVTASFRNVSARTTINQFIEVPPGAKVYTTNSKGGHGKVIAILAVIGGAAAGGAVYATQHKSSSSSGGGVTPPPTGPTPIGITPGTGTIAPPH